MSLFQGPDFDPDDPFAQPQERERPPGSKPHAHGSFRIISVTQRSLDLVNAVIDRSADFDRALAEQRRLIQDPDCEATFDAPLAAYGDLVRAKGVLVEYIARLMDRVNDRGLNEKRTAQVRFK